MLLASANSLHPRYDPGFFCRVSSSVFARLRIIWCRHLFLFSFSKLELFGLVVVVGCQSTPWGQAAVHLHRSWTTAIPLLWCYRDEESSGADTLSDAESYIRWKPKEHMGVWQPETLGTPLQPYSLASPFASRYPTSHQREVSDTDICIYIYVSIFIHIYNKSHPTVMRLSTSRPKVMQKSSKSYVKVVYTLCKHLFLSDWLNIYIYIYIYIYTCFDRFFSHYSLRSFIAPA